jgi:hypothetical protein
MDEPVWILKRAALSMHSQQLALHGGSNGIRDHTMLDSVLVKPQKVFAYEEGVDLFRLAASYAFGIARTMRLWAATSKWRWQCPQPSSPEMAGISRPLRKSST